VRGCKDGSGEKKVCCSLLQLVVACCSVLQRVECVADVLQMCYRRVADVLQMCCRCVADVLQMCCRCVADVLQRHKEEASQKLREAAKTDLEKSKYVLQHVAARCSVLQCVADVLQMCCRYVAGVMQRVAYLLQMCCRGTKKKPAKNCKRLHVRCSVLQCDAVCPQV